MPRLALLACLLGAAAALSRSVCDVRCESVKSKADCPAGVGESLESCCPFCLPALGDKRGIVSLHSPRCGDGLKCFKRKSTSLIHFLDAHGVCVPQEVPHSLLVKIANLP